MNNADYDPWALPPQQPIDPVTVANDLAGLRFRPPVVDYDFQSDRAEPWRQDGSTVLLGDEYTAGRLGSQSDRQWRVMTEVARRAILESPDARAVMVSFARAAVDEILPSQALHELVAVDARTARFMDDMKPVLGRVLELPAVPKQAASPDITHAHNLPDKENEERNLVKLATTNPDAYRRDLQTLRALLADGRGLTEAERKLIARRYEYARDIKMLSLTAELIDHPVTAQPTNGVVEQRLPSGTRLVMTEEAFNREPGLLNPAAWQGRTQLQDRVYQLRVDGKDYVLKERKTDRHRNTRLHGHADGLTSHEEFDVARQLAGLGVVRGDNIELTWEQPLGYVEFPDGFQFCVFEYDPNLDPSGSAERGLRAAIINGRPTFEAEYETLQTKAKQFYAERPDLFRRLDTGFEELTYEEFAELKTNYMLHEAEELFSETLHNRGYVTSDAYRHSMEVRHEQPPVLVVKAFDCEYYERSPEQAMREQSEAAKAKKDGEYVQRYTYKFRHRANMLAAYYVMMQDLGWRPPATN